MLDASEDVDKRRLTPTASGWLVEQHLEELLRGWPARFVRQHGPLRPAVERVLREFLKCGFLEHGFARLWCSECRRSVMVQGLF